MKIKDFLELCKDKCCYVDIVNISEGKTKQYRYISDAIRDFGYFPIVSWYMELGGLKIETKTQF